MSVIQFTPRGSYQASVEAKTRIKHVIDANGPITSERISSALGLPINEVRVNLEALLNENSIYMQCKSRTLHYQLVSGY